MAYRNKITREELIVLVGAGAAQHPFTWRDGEPITVFAARDLEYIRKRAVRIRRKANGDVEVRLSRNGKSTM